MLDCGMEVLSMVSSHGDYLAHGCLANFPEAEVKKQAPAGTGERQC